MKCAAEMEEDGSSDRSAFSGSDSQSLKKKKKPTLRVSSEVCSDTSLFSQLLRFSFPSCVCVCV